MTVVCDGAKVRLRNAGWYDDEGRHVNLELNAALRALRDQVSGRSRSL